LLVLVNLAMGRRRNTIHRVKQFSLDIVTVIVHEARGARNVKLSVLSNPTRCMARWRSKRFIQKELSVDRIQQLLESRQRTVSSYGRARWAAGKASDLKDTWLFSCTLPKLRRVVPCLDEVVDG
jgi:hypothetical protein